MFCFANIVHVVVIILQSQLQELRGSLLDLIKGRVVARWTSERAMGHPWPLRTLHYIDSQSSSHFSNPEGEVIFRVERLQQFATVVYVGRFLPDVGPRDYRGNKKLMSRRSGAARREATAKRREGSATAMMGKP